MSANSFDKYNLRTVQQSSISSVSLARVFDAPRSGQRLRERVRPCSSAATGPTQGFRSSGAAYASRGRAPSTSPSRTRPNPIPTISPRLIRCTPSDQSKARPGHHKSARHTPKPSLANIDPAAGSESGGRRITPRLYPWPAGPSGAEHRARDNHPFAGGLGAVSHWLPRSLGTYGRR
jgi:hypothetical protein